MKNLYIVMAVIAFLFCLWFGISTKYGAMGFSLTAFLGLMFFANIDKFSEFKAGKSGFEAKTREVTQVVNEAKTTIKELQALAKITASTTLSLVKRAGRIGGFSDEAEENIKKSILDVLDRLKIPKEEHNKAL